MEAKFFSRSSRLSASSLSRYACDCGAGDCARRAVEPETALELVDLPPESRTDRPACSCILPPDGDFFPKGSYQHDANSVGRILRPGAFRRTDICFDRVGAGQSQPLSGPE